MPRTSALLVLLAASVATADPPGRFPPTVVERTPSDAGTLATALAAVKVRTGLGVDAAPDVGGVPCPATFGPVPVWDALTRIAGATGTRIVLGDQGRRVTLTKRTGPPEPASVDGPFRVAVRQVRAVTDFDTGRSFTELTLELHWEPRLAVFRVSSQPEITAATDDRGSTVSAHSTATKTPTTGAAFASSVRLSGFPRGASKLTRVAGAFTVTVAERMHLVAFGPLTAVPVSKQFEGVTAIVSRVEKVENRVEVQLDLTYPPDTPEFESYESFVTENEARFVSATDAAVVWKPTDAEVVTNGRRIGAVYRFTETQGERWDLAAWRFDTTTPSPLREFPVRFDLRDVPLP